MNSGFWKWKQIGLISQWGQEANPLARVRRQICHRRLIILILFIKLFGLWAARVSINTCTCTCKMNSYAQLTANFYSSLAYIFHISRNLTKWTIHPKRGDRRPLNRHLAYAYTKTGVFLPLSLDTSANSRTVVTVWLKSTVDTRRQKLSTCSATVHRWRAALALALPHHHLLGSRCPRIYVSVWNVSKTSKLA